MSISPVSSPALPVTRAPVTSAAPAKPAAAAAPAPAVRADSDGDNDGSSGRISVKA